jgi:hypothetical protein
MYLKGHAPPLEFIQCLQSSKIIISELHPFMLNGLQDGLLIPTSIQLLETPFYFIFDKLKSLNAYLQVGALANKMLVKGVKHIVLVS